MSVDVPTDAVRFEVVGVEPVSQGSMAVYRAGAVAHGRPAHAAALAAWRGAIEREAGRAMAAASLQPFEGPVAVEATFWVQRPLAHYAGRRRSHELRRDAMTLRPVSKPDVDKLSRSLLDGLGGGAGSACFSDDSQVVELHAAKRYVARAGDEGASVSVWPLPEPDGGPAETEDWIVLEDAP